MKLLGSRFKTSKSTFFFDTVHLISLWNSLLQDFVELLGNWRNSCRKALSVGFEYGK